MIKTEPIGSNDMIITHTETRKKYFLFGKRIEIVNQYRGFCSVWHHYPSGDHCSNETQSWLCDIWTKSKWEK